MSEARFKRDNCRDTYDAYMNLGASKECHIWFALFSEFDIESLRCHNSKPIFRNLCKWFLLHHRLYDWVRESRYAFYSKKDLGFMEHIPMLVESALTSIPRDGQSSESKYIRVLPLTGAFQSSMALTSSLITSIRESRPQMTDIFTTLALYGPRTGRVTKTQLLGSLCKQLLTSDRRLCYRIQPHLADAQRALRGANHHWIYVILWRILKAMLTSPNLAQVFIITQEPSDKAYASPFLNLLTDFYGLFKTTDVRCRILIAQTESTCSKLSTKAFLADRSFRNAFCADFQSQFEELACGRTELLDLKEASIETLLDLSARRSSIQPLWSALEQLQGTSFHSIRTFLDLYTNEDMMISVFDSISPAARV